MDLFIAVGGTDSRDAINMKLRPKGMSSTRCCSFRTHQFTPVDTPDDSISLLAALKETVVKMLSTILSILPYGKHLGLFKFQATISAYNPSLLDLALRIPALPSSRTTPLSSWARDLCATRSVDTANIATKPPPTT